MSVSIVIPCHDQAVYVGEAIRSALGQTYARIEVIVVDDGSTDTSGTEIARFPVRAIPLAHSGVCVAVNTGIAASSGDMVMRLDADDMLAPTYVEETARALDTHHEAHFAYTGMACFGAREGTYPAEEFDPESLAEHNYIHASALMRRSSFDRVGGYRTDMRSVRYEDWDLWLSFVDHELPGVLVPRPLLYYRQHAAGGRNRLIRTPSGLHREVLLAARLQDHHPRIFARDRLLRRLATLPRRLRARSVSARHAALLVLFYGLLLLRSIRRS